MVAATLGLRALRLPGRSHWTHAGRVVLFGLVGMSGWLAWQLPIMELPEPDGPYPVGTMRFGVVDDTRVDPLNDALPGSRELLVELWYPAEPAPEADTVPFWQELHRGPFDWIAALGGYLGRMSSNAYPSAAPSDRHPLVVYNHGLASFT